MRLYDPVPWLFGDSTVVISFHDFRALQCTQQQGLHWSKSFMELGPKKKKSGVISFGWLRLWVTVSSTWWNMDRMKLAGCEPMGTVPCGDKLQRGTWGHPQQRAQSSSGSGLLWAPAAGLGRLLPAMNHTFDSSQDPGQLLGSGLSPPQPLLFQFWKGNNSPLGTALEWQKPRALFRGDGGHLCPFGRITISKQHPAPKCPYKGALYWGSGLGVGVALLGWGGYYHIPGDRPCEVWNFSFVDNSLKGQKKEVEKDT